MCQYTATDGLSNEWHRVHYSGPARGSAGLVIVEATAVSPEGRITPGCLGIWNDEQAEKLAQIARDIKAAGAVPGIQIAHAGRKASANRPWEGDDHIAADDGRGWETIAPSAVAFGANLPQVPKAMTLDDIARVREDFATAARRARDAGFEWLELHFAHGYRRRASSRCRLTNVRISTAATSLAAAALCWKRWKPCVTSGRKTCR